MTSSRSWLLPVFSGILALLPVGARAASCFEALAATRSYSLGLPRRAVASPDGATVYFLRGGARDTALHLYAFDVASGVERELARPAAGDEHLSVEEKARRERARMTLTGITDFSLAEDGRSLLATQGGRLVSVALPSGSVSAVPGEGWIAPRLSPDGSAVAVVRDNDLHVVELADGRDVRLTEGGSDVLTRGVAEFAAAEELGRADGTWWSPDSRKLVFEEADQAGVEQHYIADPAHPERAPVAFRYPRAGTANAVTRLGIVGRGGGVVTWISWDHAALPYVARVVWPKAPSAPLTIVVLDREQHREVVLAVDEATGRTRVLLEERDAAWINLEPMFSPRMGKRDLPRWLPDGSGFLWASERSGDWGLELRHADGSLDHAIALPGLGFFGLDDVDGADAVVTASPDRVSFGLYRVGLAGGAPVAVAAAPGVHDAAFGEGHSVLTDAYSLADGSAGVRVLKRDGGVLGELPSRAETPPALPTSEFMRVGPKGLDAVVYRPSGFQAGRHYPVVLSVYAGPGVKNVIRTARGGLADQCLADQGFIVATIDGRGTPGRGRDFERATRGDLIDAPLEDQVEGLRALGARIRRMDLHRVGVEGWSFGGYFSAMATIRRPDVFSAGVAGAPVVDFQDYDTAYTERYLGVPQDAAGAYKVSNVLTYADQLSRPLLIMHGLTDDNVYFQNTAKLIQALFVAGKPYRLIVLPGTHQLPDPKLRARVDEARTKFLLETLGGSTAP